MSLFYFHNPNCSKSRAGLALLNDLGRDFNCVMYLNELDEDLLRKVLTNHSGPIGDLIRTAELEKLDLKLRIDDLEETALIALILRYPIILQRPLVLSGSALCIGRPTEAISEFLSRY